MKTMSRLRIAIQKKGRLNDDSLVLLSKSILNITPYTNTLLFPVENYPIDILLVRDDDIPCLVMEGACDVGIVGENVLFEKTTNPSVSLRNNPEIIKKLGFSRCRLSIAIPEAHLFSSPTCLDGRRIATSYPNLLKAYLKRHSISAEVLVISGSVEIAPQLDLADAICDLVATGRTLKENKLKEVDEVMQSEAVLIKSTRPLTAEKIAVLNLVLSCID